MFLLILLWILLYFMVGVIGGMFVIRFWSKRDHYRFYPDSNYDKDMLIFSCGMGMLFWPVTIAILGCLGLWFACKKFTYWIFRHATRTTG